MTFAHELGHNMGLKHDRYTEHGGNNLPYPYSVGYVNQRAFDSRAPESSRWRTVMAYNDQCDNAGFHCTQLFRFSNPDQTYSIATRWAFPETSRLIPWTARPMPGGV